MAQLRAEVAWDTASEDGTTTLILAAATALEDTAAERDRAHAVWAILDEIESWYPESVFPPLPPAKVIDGEVVNEEVSRDRISAHMARHVVQIIRERLGEQPESGP